MGRHVSCPICRSSALQPRDEKLRDSDTIAVVQCATCKHVFLDSFDHVNEDYFVNDTFLLSKPFLHGVEERLRHYEAENQERTIRIGPLVLNKRVLEFGCGAGALMEKIRPMVSSIEGLERTASFRARLQGMGYAVHQDLSQTQGSYDVILMFHVLEHLSDAVESIRGCVDRLSPNGLLYIEVPNIDDALLTLYDVGEYRKFHFFKDHLHYFSRASLTEAIQQAGAMPVSVSGHSRFGLANHMYWLRYGKPGGHLIWNFLETPPTRLEYSRALAAANISDSLVAQIRKAPAQRPTVG